MQKLLLLSIIIALITIPTLAARDPIPRRGWRRAVVGYVTFCVVYVFAVKFLYFRLN